MIDLTGKFSLPYPSFSTEGWSYYYLLEKATQEYRDEISDIYFSAPFVSEDGDCVYGDTMGSAPHPDHYEWILKINNELKIPISLTYNTLEIDRRLTEKYFDEFIEHVRWWYDNGIRSCTISNTHMMATKRLHREFPEMHWKNTVNHMVDNAQEVLDYYKIGYDTVLLDRSLNRNWKELAEIKKLQKEYPQIKTSLLVTEGCAPNCLFKKEHDNMQTDPDFKYWDNHGTLSCKIWRGEEGISELPRIGTDIVAVGTKNIEEVLGLADIFKFSGRMGDIPPLTDRLKKDHTYKFGWAYHNRTDVTTRWFRHSMFVDEHFDKNTVQFRCFREILEMNQNLALSNILPAQIVSEDKLYGYENNQFSDISIWTTSKKAKALEKTLQNCNNQCWDCHACERVFGLDDFDSYIDVQRDDIHEEIDFSKAIKLKTD